MKKNFWTKMLGMMLVLICAISLVACGGGKKSDAAGTYKLESVSVGGVTMTMDDLASTMGEAGVELDMSLELKADGKFTLDMAALDENMSMEGTWKDKGKTIDLTADGDTLSAAYENGTITLEAEGTSMTFKKG